jgi:hypothetical protein
LGGVWHAETREAANIGGGAAASALFCGSDGRLAANDWRPSLFGDTMDDSDLTPSPDTNEALDLGKILGRREALSVIAGRCSAAEAACLRQIRQQRQYASFAPSWDEFCAEYLHISRSNADRIIRLLDEFGPAYFELSQLTRISPETYRAIAPAIGEEGLAFQGETIAITAGNAEKLSTALVEMRRSRGGSGGGPRDAFAEIEKRWREMLAGLAKMERPLAWRRRADLLGLLRGLKRELRDLDGLIGFPRQKLQ